MKRLLPIILIAILGLSVPFFASAPVITLDQALAKLDAFNRTFHSMQASLEKTDVTTLVESRDVSNGEIFYKKGKTSSQIRMDIKTPSPESVLVSAGKITLYYPKMKQAQQGSIGGANQAESHLFEGLGSSSEDLRKTYDITLDGEAVIDGRSTAILNLKPKTTARFSSVRLWIDEQAGNPAQIQLNEPDKEYTVFKFIKPKFNVDLPNSTFDVKSMVPSGVKIQPIG